MCEWDSCDVREIKSKRLKYVEVKYFKKTVVILFTLNISKVMERVQRILYNFKFGRFFIILTAYDCKILSMINIITSRGEFYPTRYIATECLFSDISQSKSILF